MNIEKKHLGELGYVIRYPDAYTPGERFPVLMFLHGAGSRGTDLDRLVSNPFFAHTAKHEHFPFITVAPLCSENTWFDMLHLLKSLLCDISRADFADPERIYLMGASMGGYATWQLAMSEPELVAAIVPICGGGMYWNAARLAKIPVWAHHGALDTTVDLEESKKMVNAVNDRGGCARLTVYPDIAHPSWIPVYKNPEVFEWLLSNRRVSDHAHQDDFNDGVKYG